MAVAPERRYTKPYVVIVTVVNDGSAAGPSVQTAVTGTATVTVGDY